MAVAWHSRRNLEGWVTDALHYAAEGWRHSVQISEYGWGHRETPNDDPFVVPEICFHLPTFRIMLRASDTPERALFWLLILVIEELKGFEYRWAMSYFGLTYETATIYPDKRHRVADSKLQTSREEIRELVYKEVFETLVGYLCEGAPDYGPSPLPEIASIEQELKQVLKDGLPVGPQFATADLVGLLPDEEVLAELFDGPHPLGPAARLNTFLTHEINHFTVDKWRDAARILFACAPGYKGSTLTRRREGAALTIPGNRATTTTGKREESSMSERHFRGEIEPKIVASLAWQLYAKKLGERDDYLRSS
ncbi:hypothetical protein [Amycolatopsis sp. NPDC051716]|uniref:hypothetical protein n=1 Tax=Amycolatopsis sp. NPDC051716 TaxID=3155804 RepID=UPI0034382E66